MDIVFRVLYAAYGKGTHHKLALDALNALAGPDAEGWRRLLLSRADRLVAGSKAPDDLFKDFTNHVLHPRDAYWGGAPAAATEAYGRLVAALTSRDWDEAAWHAGILSHYVVDPLMPFHTAQSVAENNVHRAVEWSINRAYDALREEGLRRGSPPTMPLSLGSDWLGALVRAGADRSNVDYERLLAHYDITRGVVDPPAGLDLVARRIIADLLVAASRTFAFVLDRATTESGVSPPETSLVLPTIIAGLNIPKTMWLKRLVDQQDRKIVEAMYDELMATGKVEANLPADDRMVRECHAAEVTNARKVRATPASNGDAAFLPAATAARPLTEHPVSGTLASLFSMAPIPEPEPQSAVVAPATDQELVGEQSSVEREPAATDKKSPPMSGVKLAVTDELEAAPSIGPRMAERFATIGIRTVGDFLAGDPGAMEERLDHRGIDAKTLAEWQRQARLVMDIPGLTGTQARLLTGAGFATAKAVAAADPVALCAAVLKYAISGPGRQVLRDHAPPEADKIVSWVARAKAA